MKFALPTYYAPAKRAASADLQRSMELACMSLVIDGVMRAVGDMVAVLNEHRQILTVNDALLRVMGIDGGAVLGLRPGEVLQCEHAREMPGGCGTSRYCSTCGAAIAIAACLKENTDYGAEMRHDRKPQWQGRGPVPLCAGASNGVGRPAAGPAVPAGHNRP